MQEVPKKEGFECDDSETTSGKRSPVQEVTQEVPPAEGFERDDAEKTGGKISPEQEVMQEVPRQESYECHDAGMGRSEEIKVARQDGYENSVNNGDQSDEDEKIEGERTVAGDGNGKIFTEYRNQKENESDDGDGNHDEYSGGKTVPDDDDDKKVEPFKPLSSSSSEIEEIGIVKSTSEIPSRFEATPQFNPFKVDAYLAQKYKSCSYDKPSEDESNADEDMMIPIIRRSQRLAQKDWFMGVRCPFSETLRKKRRRIEEVLERDRYSDRDDDVKKMRA